MGKFLVFTSLVLCTVYAAFYINMNSKYAIFHNSLSEQISSLKPTKVELQDSFIPNYVEPVNSDSFIVYAYKNSSKSKDNIFEKQLFLFDTRGNIIDSLKISSTCEFPYTLKDVGLVMDYCKPQTSAIYVIKNNKIELLNETSPKMDSSSAARIVQILKNDGSENRINSNLIYKRTCVDSWGSCSPRNETLSSSKETIILKGYSLRDQAIINDNLNAIIFGKGSPAMSSGFNELYIVPSGN